MISRDNRFRLINVLDKRPATQLVWRGGTVTIANLDGQNTIFIGDNHKIATTDQEVAPIGPGQSIPFDGTIDVYGITPTGISVSVLALPGAIGWFGSAGQSPSAVPPSVTSKAIGSGLPIDLIGNVKNPNGLPIQILSACLSSTASNFGGGGGSSGFAVEDMIQDDNGVPYLNCDISLPALAANVSDSNSNSVTLKYDNAVVPAGRKLVLQNGGASGTGALRRCSATVVYYLINSGT